MTRLAKESLKPMQLAAEASSLYDSRDRLTTEVDGAGRIVTHAFDAAGRKLSLTDGAGRIWRWVYDSLGRVTAEMTLSATKQKAPIMLLVGCFLKPMPVPRQPAMNSM